MALSKAEKARRADEQRDAVEYVRAWIDTIPLNEGHGDHCGDCEGHQSLHLLVTHVARSGASRRIKVLAIDGARIVNLSYRVGKALGWRINEREGSVVVDGGGMDMGFALVYNLSVTLYGLAGRGGYRLRKEWI